MIFTDGVSDHCGKLWSCIGCKTGNTTRRRFHKSHTNPACGLYMKDILEEKNSKFSKLRWGITTNDLDQNAPYGRPKGHKFIGKKRSLHKSSTLSPFIAR